VNHRGHRGTRGKTVREKTKIVARRLLSSCGVRNALEYAIWFLGHIQPRATESRNLLFAKNKNLRNTDKRHNHVNLVEEIEEC